MTVGPLAGRHVVTTRERPGRLDSLLALTGADVINVPLICIGSPLDGGTALRASLADLDDGQWVVVTSHHGARAVGEACASHAGVRLAAVGSSTASVLSRLAGRPVDVVPERQTAADLVAAMPRGTGRVVIAQADRAASTVADGLGALGYDVTAVTAYRTVLRAPSRPERRAAVAADAVAFASGSAAEAWVAAFGTGTSPVVVAIGPTTAQVARRLGLEVAQVATDQHIDGLVDAVMAALA